MNRLRYIISAAAIIFMAAACSKNNTDSTPYIDPSVIGEWHLTGASSEGSAIYDDLDVYMTLNPDCTFELYQKSGTQTRYDKYTGIFHMTDEEITGTYADGSPWGSKYIASVSGDTLTLCTTDMMEVQTYKREALSKTEKEKANLKTKADNDSAAPIL